MRDMRISFDPLSPLTGDSPYSKDALKEDIFKLFRARQLVGQDVRQYEVDFQPASGHDILVKRIDPENALGYSVYSGEQDYFNQLLAQQYEPSAEELGM